MFNVNNHRKAVIVDLDGTLTDNRPRLHLAKEGKWDDFHAEGANDRPNRHVIDVINSLAMTGYQIIIFTGRPENFAKSTIEWLDAFKVTWHFMEMRRVGDYTPNEEMKRKWHRAYSKDLSIMLAIDDMQKTCDMWRELGVPVMKVETDE